MKYKTFSSCVCKHEGTQNANLLRVNLPNFEKHFTLCYYNLHSPNGTIYGEPFNPLKHEFRYVY
jgi:hypothetical protein